MTPTRIGVLVAAAAVAAAVAWLMLRVVYTSLPPLPWTAAVAMLLLAGAEAASGRNLRARIRTGVGGKPLAPIAVARMAVLGKASSHAGAIFAGLAAGTLSYLAGLLDKSVPRDDAFAAGGTLAAAVILVIAALYLERSCRVPDSDRDAGAGYRSGG